MADSAPGACVPRTQRFAPATHPATHPRGSRSTADSPLNCDAGNLLRGGDVRGYASLARMYTLEHAVQRRA